MKIKNLLIWQYDPRWYPSDQQSGSSAQPVSSLACYFHAKLLKIQTMTKNNELNDQANQQDLFSQNDADFLILSG